jgi:hypothetical protein
VTDRPIIFSGPMVRALHEGRKTQTRRLATSPLRRCEVGDRLYVRESVFGGTPGVANVIYRADGEAVGARWTPSIHMPRWASRLTLTVTDLRVQPLQAISEADAIAEGVGRRMWDVESGDDMEIVDGWGADRFITFRHGVGDTAREGFQILWNALHTKAVEAWEANPEVVALTFAVQACNIDRLRA